jgi:PAS domain S-box-containing protein
VTSAPLPANETERLKALAEFQILDTPEESAYDAFTRLAREITGSSISTISLIDEHRQWFKSRQGLEATETPRDVAFCSHVVASGNEMVVNDAQRDDRFADNPLVTGDPNIRFYAGVPLTTHEGYTLGTLCVMDPHPRDITPEQLVALQAVGRALMSVLDGRRRFLTLFDAANIDVFTVEPQTQRILFASRGACRRLRYSLKELVSKSMFEVLKATGEAGVQSLIERARAGEEIVREDELERSDGSTYPVELRVDVTSENGDERMLMIAQDLSQRNAQQREIALLIGAMNVAGDVILVYSVEEGSLRLSYVNDTFALQTGYTREEALGKDVGFFRKDMPEDQGMRTVREAIAKGVPAQAELVSYRKDGSTYWNQVSLHPIRTPDGAITHWISIERDITSDVERNAALAEEHDRLLALTRAARRLFTTFDTANIVGIVREVVGDLLRADARVLAVGDEGASVEVTQLGAAEWERSTLDPLVDRAVTSRVRIDDDARALSYAGRFGDARYVLEVCSRSRRPLRATDLFVFDLIAEYFAVAVRNVALYHEVEERRAAVLELNQTKSDLIAMLAHDFRGPLTSIVGFADLTGEVGEINDEQQSFLQTIKRSALQLSELATDTLTLSRLERNEVSLSLGDTSLGDLIGAVVGQMADRREVALTIEGDTRVTGDQDRLRQVFTNLIDNAIKYTPSGAQPEVLVHGDPETVTVTVRDRGIGIPAGELSRIFDRFSRASNARKMRISGTGFGLYLTKQLVQLHGGTIAVESEENEGSTFTVILPRRVDRAAAPRTVLVLDRERDQSYLAYGLQEAGYRIVGAATIEEALGAADAAPFDAIVITTPETLSPELVVQLRTVSRERSIPLVAIGADAAPRLAATATLTRPAAIVDVVATLDRILERE